MAGPILPLYSVWHMTGVGGGDQWLCRFSNMQVLKNAQNSQCTSCPWTLSKSGLSSEGAQRLRNRSVLFTSPPPGIWRVLYPNSQVPGQERLASRPSCTVQLRVQGNCKPHVLSSVTPSDLSCAFGSGVLGWGELANQSPEDPEVLSLSQCSPFVAVNLPRVSVWPVADQPGNLTP